MKPQVVHPGVNKIVIEDLRKSFNGKRVLDGINLTIQEGESFVLMGGSGTGKSVLVKHIIGLMRPDSGRILIDGTDIGSLDDRELNEFRRRFGMTFQEGALFDSMSVYDNVAFGLRRNSGFDPTEIDRRVEECLRMVNLSGVGGKKPNELSGGMRRRVGFARAIAMEPEIVLYDEPTTGLDPVLTAVIDNIILDMKRELRITSVTITHNLKSAEKVADRIAMLHAGKIVEVAPPQDFIASTNPIIRQFVEGRADGPLTDQAD